MAEKQTTAACICINRPSIVFITGYWDVASKMLRGADVHIGQTNLAGRHCR
jgi:hypothetical protein